MENSIIAPSQDSEMTQRGASGDLLVQKSGRRQRACGLGQHPTETLKATCREKK